MKRRKSYLGWAALGAAAGIFALGARPVQAQSASAVDVFGRAYQIFMWISQNSYKLDTPDGKAAPCRDPWVSSAFRLVFGREPNATGDSGECNYRNFGGTPSNGQMVGGGSWNSYRDLVWKTAWYRAYKEMGLVRGGAGLDASLATPDALQPLVSTAVAEVTGRAAASTPVERGTGYELIKERVEDVYYSCSDGEISRAIIAVTGRAPRGSEYQGECNPMLYGKGKWSDYSDLTGKVRRALVRDSYKIGECRDAEITRAITEIKKMKGDARPYPSGMGELGECNSYLYGYGHWSNYADLKSKVAQSLGELAASNIQLQPDNSIRTVRMERGGGGGALMALLAAANAYMQWKASQPPKESRDNYNKKAMRMQGNMQGGMQGNMQGGMMQQPMMQPGMDPNAMGGMQMPGGQMPMQGNMQGNMMQMPMQQGMTMIQPGAQMPMMAPQVPQMQMQMQMPMMQGNMQMPMQQGNMQQQPMMQPGMMPAMPAGM